MNVVAKNIDQKINFAVGVYVCVESDEENFMPWLLL